ncbi:Cytochrome c1-2 [Hibiscus syriacus]|uniref:Cytochrome c1-2 n=1 Tax=Hibiscus syriacus TaxID=106335 RepID=A0A6A3CNE3_HIBSY|nr:Cytochrome c1-2 [Hibiscus syriacus]
MMARQSHHAKSLPAKGRDRLGSAYTNSFEMPCTLWGRDIRTLGCSTVACSDEAEHVGDFKMFCHVECLYLMLGHQVLPTSLCILSFNVSNLIRDLVGVAYTEEETKAIAAEIEVVDGPNDEGEMFTRPGKLSDRFPQPYAMSKQLGFPMEVHIPGLEPYYQGRHNGQNYVFGLLTGYRDPPAGVSVVPSSIVYNSYVFGVSLLKLYNVCCMILFDPRFEKGHYNPTFLAVQLPCRKC